MHPVSPVIEGFQSLETVLGKGQDQYRPLPVLWCDDDNGTVISKWKIGWRERLRILFSGELYISQLTFVPAPAARHFQPQLPSVKAPGINRKE